MTLKGGYFRKYLHCDLSAGTCERLPLSDEIIAKYIGGRGFGAKMVWDNLKAHDFKIDPLGPENLLVIAPGPLTGVYLPASGKTSFVSISPATGLYGDSSMGGSFGVELRQAGLDFLSVIGSAPELSILFIDDDEEAKIIPMPQLKGKTCLETEGIINKKNIAKMKDGVIILNNSRGPLVVEQDLADALNSGKVYAAGLDVVSTEPIKGDNPLLKAKNCILTPHISWAPKESRQRLLDIAVNNAKAFVNGAPVNVVNP
jgi:hypothetical protein